ncbi:MAG: metallophosphoesterase family protein [Bacteroidetes bacterium]|nr:metallophosphoesterase family protein [Bacteroidota bacterium]
MKTAAVYDIHGNLPALEAVLAEADKSGVDVFVIGGDVVTGPMSGQCLDRLSEIRKPVHFIKGNCEVHVLDYSEHKKLRPLPEQVLKDIKWTSEQLSHIQRDFIKKWSMTVKINTGSYGEILFCHAVPENENDIFTKLTPESDLLPLFENLNVNTVVCGHTHMQFDRNIGKVRVINAGSVGMPFGKSGAYWLLLGNEPELKFTEYDLQTASRRIMQTGYLFADDFVKKHLLNPPSEEEMLALFSTADKYF